jgi:lipopolysaccharide/colanic/teichoic acid biosynthesis glycosyltransferase
MSLVGPRPEQPELVGALEHRLPFYDRRHLMKPGITGWAQIRCGYAGSDAGTTWKLCHDLYYFKRRTLAFDVLIMLEAVTSTLLAAQFGRRRPERVFVLDAAPDPEGASR